MKKLLPAFSIAYLVLMIGHTQLNQRGGREARAELPRLTAAPWKLVWSAEFNGSEIDKSKWDFALGTGYWIPMPNPWGGFWVKGWGNEELQCYTNRPENIYIKDGMLHIKR